MRPTRPGGLDGRTVPLTVHVRAAETLTAWAHRRETPRDLVLTPERLHRRNLKRALAAADRPRSSLVLTDPADVAARVAGDRTTRSLDRADRLRLLGDVLADPPDGADALRRALGSDLSARAETVEALREEFDVVAGGVGVRDDALRTVADALPAHARDETRALVHGVRGVERALAERADRDVSPVTALHAARDALAASDGAAWTDAYPTVERLAVAGVSTLTAPLLDFLAHVAAHTDVDVHLFLRARTGPRIAARLPARLRALGDVTVDVSVQSGSDAAGVGGDVLDDDITRAVDALAGDDATRTDAFAPLRPDAPVAELVATSRREEARAALATVDALLERGVPVSDVALVARDVDRYERALRRAAREYGHHLSVWTQLALRETLPYRSLVACVDLLAARAERRDDDTAARVDADALFAPLDYEWVPPDARPGSVWPLAHRDVAAVRRRVDDGRARTLDAWATRLADVPGPAAAGVRRLVHWARERPAAPAPETVEDALTPLLDAYADVVLPARLDADTPDLDETSQTARALSRTRKLLTQARGKYADWRRRGHVDAGWRALATVLDAVATTRPGRREHDNAERLDVLDANDTWLRDYRYVVALGLVDGEWPERPDGALPAAVRDAVVAGDGPARRLGVRGAWTEERDADHFADAARAATDALVLTRFTEDADGARVHRSPLLDTVDADASVVADADLDALLAADRRLPDALRRIVPETEVPR